MADSYCGLTQPLNWIDSLKSDCQLIFVSRLLKNIEQEHKTQNLQTIKYPGPKLCVIRTGTNYVTSYLLPGNGQSVY